MASVTRTSAEILVNTTTTGNQGASRVAAFGNGGYVVTWEDGSVTGNRIAGKQYSAAGSTNGQFDVAFGGSADTAVHRPYIASLADGGYVITWSQSPAPETDPFDDLYGRTYSPTGNPKSTIGIDNLPITLDKPVPIGLSTGKYVVAYQLGNAIAQRGFTASDASVGPDEPQYVSQGAGYDPVIAASSDGGYVVAWTANDSDGSAGGIYFRRYNADFNPISGPAQANLQYIGDQSQPDIAGLEDGSFVIAWISASPTDTGYDIRAQRFSADGVRLGSEFKANTTVAGDQTDPQITALSDGGFVVLWTANGQDGSGQGIFAQRYTASGVRVGGEIVVNATISGDQVAPSVAALPNGGFVVSWTAQDASGAGIFSRTFQAPGTFSGTTSVATEIVEGTGANETFNAAPGTLRLGDEIFGGAGTDRLQLTAGGTFDLAAMTAFKGVEQIFGSSGNDTLIVSTESLADVTFVSLGGGANVAAAVGSFTLKAGLNIAAIRAADPAGLQGYSYTGNDYGQTITGNAGANIIRGEGGNDTLTGAGGNDFLFGGKGNDTFYVETNNDAVRESVGEGSDTVLAATTFGLAAGVSVEFLKTQNEASRTPLELRGNELAQTITGNAGDNVLNGRGGADVLTGLAGADFYEVGDTRVRIVEAAGGGTDTVRSTVTYTLAANVENLRLDGTADLRGTGNALDNTINGNSGKNVLYGLAGNDIFGGEGGGDTEIGGLGNDTYYVNSDDTIVERAGEGVDKLIFSFGDPTYVLGANISIETMQLADAVATTARNLTGNNFGQSLIGNAAGNVLTGLGGLDQLTGGGGADSFVFRTVADSTVASTGRDTIKDFSRVQGDKIDLSLIDANTAEMWNQSFVFIGTGAFTKQAGELRYAAAGANTVVSGDVNGDGAADFSILVNKTTFVAGDFLL